MAATPEGRLPSSIRRHDGTPSPVKQSASLFAKHQVIDLCYPRLFALRRWFPLDYITGIDVNPYNIKRC